jgi:flagellar hook protein FlgE
MKKIIGILFFALTFNAMKVNAQGSNGTTTESFGIIESINDNGTGTVRDVQTGELKSFLTRDGEFHRDGNGAFVLIVGTPVTYIEVSAPAQADRPINVVIKVNGRDI